MQCQVILKGTFKEKTNEGARKQEGGELAALKAKSLASMLYTLSLSPAPKQLKRPHTVPPM